MDVQLHSPVINLFPPLKINHAQSYVPNTSRNYNFANVTISGIFPRQMNQSRKVTAACTTNSSGAVISNFTAQDSNVNFNWIVKIDKSSANIGVGRAEIINYCVRILQKALCSDEKDAQRRIYGAAYDTSWCGFCCFVDEHTSRVLAGIPGVLSVKLDADINAVNKDYSNVYNLGENSVSVSPELFPKGSEHWLVCVEKPSATVNSKAQIVDYFVNILSGVVGNEKDAQMCLYHVSWQSNYEFCCILDEEDARQLAVVPGVLSVQRDEHFESKIKDGRGHRLLPDVSDSHGMETSKTKLFITGLSFYTSEKTLRAAFEPFGELVGVKVIMDKISKRSKGFAFVEYAIEDNASMALREMNGKIINGWMIAVDRAKSKRRFTKG